MDILVGIGIEIVLVLLLQDLQTTCYIAERLLQIMGCHVGELLKVFIGANQVFFRPFALTDISGSSEDPDNLPGIVPV